MKLCDRPRDMPRPKVHISYDMIYQIKDQFQISRPITKMMIIVRVTGCEWSWCQLFSTISFYKLWAVHKVRIIVWLQ